MNPVNLHQDIKIVLEQFTGYADSKQPLTDATALLNQVKDSSKSLTLTTEKIALIQAELLNHAVVEAIPQVCETILYSALVTRRDIVLLRDFHPNNKKLLGGWGWGVRTIPDETLLFLISRNFVDSLANYVLDFREETASLLQKCNDIKSLIRDPNYQAEKHPRHYAHPDMQGINDEARDRIPELVDELKSDIARYLDTYTLTVNEQIVLVQHLSQLVGPGWKDVHFRECSWITSLEEGANKIAAGVENLYLKSRPNPMDSGCMMGWNPRVAVNRVKWSLCPFDQGVLKFANRIDLSKRSSSRIVSSCELNYILVTCQRLQVIKISGARLINSSAFPDRNRYPRLEKLYISAVGDIGEALMRFPTIFPNLKKLDISINDHVLPHHLPKLAELTSLTALKIDHCLKITQSDVEELQKVRRELRIQTATTD